jgi:hypothetical protein
MKKKKKQMKKMAKILNCCAQEEKTPSLCPRPHVLTRPDRPSFAELKRTTLFSLYKRQCFLGFHIIADPAEECCRAYKVPRCTTGRKDDDEESPPIKKQKTPTFLVTLL